MEKKRKGKERKNSSWDEDGNVKQIKRISGKNYEWEDVGFMHLTDSAKVCYLLCVGER